MTNVTAVLGAAPGIQWQGEQDNSGTTTGNAFNVGVVLGRFKRGILGKPFRVSQATIQKRLGYDPTNFDYMAVQDVLDLGVPYIWVQRVRAGVASEGEPAEIATGESGIETSVSAWNAFEGVDAKFYASINGVNVETDPIDFSAATTMQQVAQAIAAAINTPMPLVTLTYAAGQFTMTTLMLGSGASIDVNIEAGGIMSEMGFLGKSDTGEDGVTLSNVYTPIERNIFVANDSGVTVTLGAGTNPPGTSVKITYGLLDILDEGCKLDVQFFTRSGAALTAGKPTSLKDISATLTFKDSDTGEKLYVISGLLAANGSALTLAQAAADMELFSTFTVTLVGTDSAAADDVITSSAGNLPGGLGRNKVTLNVPAEAGANAIVPASFYTKMTNVLTYGTLRPNYLAIAKTDDLSLIIALMKVAKEQARNCVLMGDVDPELPLDSAIAVSIGIEAKDYHVRWFWNPTKSRPRDATTIRGGKIFRPCVGVQLGYSLLRNANTNPAGIPPLQNPIAGYDFPLPFKGLEPREDMFFDQDTLDRLAEARINPVILEQGESGARFIFGDLLTQYEGEEEDNAPKLANASEILMYTANLVVDIIRRHLRKGMDNFIELADRDCRELLDNCVVAGLLKPAENLGGKPYVLSITPREDRPFDAVDVKFGRRPAGAVRAAFLDTSVEK